MSTGSVGPSAATARHPFEYAVLRVMPRIDRGEFVNAGVILYCRTLDFLGVRVDLDVERIRSLDPSADATSITAALDTIADLRITAATTIGSHFRWLTAPRSTVVQPGPIHTGLTADAATELDRLLRLLVHPVASGD